MKVKNMLSPKILGTLCAVSALATGAHAGVMMEGFYPNVPSPAAGTATASWWWDHMGAQANAIRQAGFTAVWIPPALKGAAGGYSGGYDPFDDYDLGSKNEQSTYTTRFGTREQLERCCAMLRANGLDILLDIVDNHRGGDDGHFNFNYVDAYGNANAGRFQKGPGDFHWSFSTNNLPEDPNVPDPAADYNYQFGRDLAPINGFKGSDGQGYVYEGLMKSGDWMTKALDAQGFRLDDVKGISTDWLLPFLNYGAMANKFAVGEYFDANIGTLNNWIQNSMQNRSSVFDFSLHDQIHSMCNSGGYYDMSQLDHAGLTGINPGGAVTFVDQDVGEEVRRVVLGQEARVGLRPIHPQSLISGDQDARRLLRVAAPYGGGIGPEHCLECRRPLAAKFVAVTDKQRSPQQLRVGDPLEQVDRDFRLATSRRHGQQDALLAARDLLQGRANGRILIVAAGAVTR